jgi:hypothetical protein
MILSLLTSAPFAAAVLAQAPAPVSFNREVRPILSNNCFYCHGPDEKHREADLRLDIREGATADLGGRSAIVPGDPAASELMSRVEAHDEDLAMPPADSKRPRLTEQEVAVLRQWISEGAEFEGHWAFLPLAESPPPQAKQASTMQNPIDRFVLARLEQEGLTPSAEAERALLMRRVSLDLTGLLPSPDEVDAFVRDSAPDAYERLVDRLLASPHYGERWGRHWLDQARYADSNGYSIDGDRAMWPYRDWVIKSLNDDLPFDQFTVEQLAGDLLPEPSKNQIVATAFHRNTLINEEGGTDRTQFRHEAVVDRVNTTGAVWLGLTLACAQCHTHKFDPIPHRDYYAFFAFFNHGTDVNDKGATLRVARGEVFGAPLVTEAAPLEMQLAQAQSEWEADLRGRIDAKAPPVEWRTVEYVSYETKSGAKLRLLEDQSLLSDGQASSKDAYRVTAKTSLPKVAAVRLRTLPHESLPKQGPGTASNGNFVLTEFQVRMGERPLKIAAAFADHEQPGYPATATTDADASTGWAINVGPGSKAPLNALHEAVFVFDEPAAIGEESLKFELLHDLNDNYLVGRFALDVAETAPSLQDRLDPRLVEVLAIPPERRDEKQAALAREAFLRARPDLDKKIKAKLPDVADLMVMQELASPRQTFVYQRGDFLRPDEETGPLSPDVLTAVPPALPAEGKRDRLTLAKWLVDPANPLTARVRMNRVWMRYFGRGLVETEEDFGTQGSPPTHPELLDLLAGEFIRRGWSQKAMHRLIVTSATYRQSSQVRPELLEADPRNLLLARQERVRFEAEIVRDAALAASGLLDRTIGGPSVRPPQPGGIYAFTQNPKSWEDATGSDRYRRALYTQFYRSAPYPLFSTFDAPDFQTTCTRRLRSNSPLQALTVANDPAFFELAQGLAARTLREVPGDAADRRIDRLFRLALSREPSDEEASLLLAYYERELQRLRADTKAAAGMPSPDLANNGIESAAAAATVSVARVILNTDAFITRE